MARPRLPTRNLEAPRKRGEIRNVDGGVEDAYRDFNSLGPKNIRERPGGGQIGDLPGGGNAVIRSSKSRELTLEVKEVGPTGKEYYDKFRYTQAQRSSKAGGP